MTTIVHEISRKIAILIRTVFHGFSWKLSIKYDELSRKLMGFHGSVHRDKLILAGRIYEFFEFYARQIVKCCRTFCILAVFLKKKRCPANFNCLYKAFFSILLSPVYLLIVLKLDVMSRELPNSYRIYRTCPAKFETVQIVCLFWT